MSKRGSEPSPAGQGRKHARTSSPHHSSAEEGEVDEGASLAIKGRAETGMSIKGISALPPRPDGGSTPPPKLSPGKSNQYSISIAAATKKLAMPFKTKKKADPKPGHSDKAANVLGEDDYASAPISLPTHSKPRRPSLSPRQKRHDSRDDPEEGALSDQSPASPKGKHREDDRRQRNERKWSHLDSRGYPVDDRLGAHHGGDDYDDGGYNGYRPSYREYHPREYHYHNRRPDDRRRPERDYHYHDRRDYDRPRDQFEGVPYQRAEYKGRSKEERSRDSHKPRSPQRRPRSGSQSSHGRTPPPRQPHVPSGSGPHPPPGRPPTFPPPPNAPPHPPNAAAAQPPFRKPHRDPAHAFSPFPLLREDDPALQLPATKTGTPSRTAELLEADMDFSQDTPSPTASSQQLPTKSALSQRVFLGCSPIEAYSTSEKVGEGTFGVVTKGVREAEVPPVTYKGKQPIRVKKGDAVALKKIINHNENDGLPITALREIRLLRLLDHPNVVSVVDMAYKKGDGPGQRGEIFMVFPYMDHDLAGLLENSSVKLQISHIKSYAKQLLEGTHYLHANKILHRDMKAANLLISKTGVLQIADFGLARAMKSPEYSDKYTTCVVTRWYRPPELLLENRMYGFSVDMWGIGCIIAEMFKKSPILPGTSDLDQLNKIFALCGSPTDENMPGWRDLPGCGGVKDFGEFKPKRISEEYSAFGSEHLVSLLDCLLQLNHKSRHTAAQALDHDWFWSEPLPCDSSSIPEWQSSHEIDKRKRYEAQQVQVQQNIQQNMVQAVAAQQQAAAYRNGILPGPNMMQQQPPMNGMQRPNIYPQQAVHNPYSNIVQQPIAVPMQANGYQHPNFPQPMRPPPGYNNYANGPAFIQGQPPPNAQQFRPPHPQHPQQQYPQGHPQQKPQPQHSIIRQQW